MRKVLFALVVLCCHYFAVAEVKVELNPNGFSVSASGLSKLLDTKSDYGAEQYLLRDTGTHTFSLRFSFGLPKFDDATVKYSCENLLPVDGIAKNDLAFQLNKHFLGTRRGVEIADILLQPFVSKQGKAYIADSIFIDVKFNSKANYLPSTDKSPISPAFFADLINSRQANFIELSNENFKKSEQIQAGNSWYRPELKYLKISTRKDGIAKIAVSKIISLVPEWRDLDIAGLHLLRNGEDYPIYVNSPNGLITDEAEILFIGSRAKGDTTWFDNYTDIAAFYLCYDISSSPLRLKAMPQVIADKEITEVDVNCHIEKEKEYFLGTVDIFPRTDQFEGWYWAKLHRVAHSGEIPLLQFSENFNFIPPANGELEISYKYRTLNTAKSGSGVAIGGIDPEQSYYFNTLLNGDTVSTVSLNKWTDDFVSIKGRRDMFYAGSNSIRIINKRVDTSNGMLGIDYFNIKGKAEPLVINDFVQFDVSHLGENSKINIGGFGSSKMYAIDTISSAILIASGTEGYRFVASAGKSATVVLVNDSLARFEGSGLLLGYKGISGKLNLRHYSGEINSNEIISQISNLPDSSLIIAAYNSDYPLPAGLANYFVNLGSKMASLAVAGNYWSFACKKGLTSEIYENSNQSIASINGFIPAQNAGSFSASINLEANKAYSLFCAADSAIEDAAIESVANSNLRGDLSPAELVIISHSKFINEAKLFEQYRKGKGVKVRTIDVEDIYKEFGYGKKSPHSIKEFLKFAYNNWAPPKLQYLLIVGDASWDARKIVPGSKGEDWVPSFGQPVTDYWYSFLNSDDPNNPDLIVGRIPAQEPAQVKSYYDKVVAFEKQPNASWMKNFMFLSGGDETERRSFANYRYDVFDKVVPYPVCGDTVWVGIESREASSEELGPKILSHLNSGVIWTHFFGHASSQVFDLDGWQVEYMNNKERTGFLSTLACNAGAFAEPLDLHGRNETYILAKDVGFVAAFGSTGVGLVDGAAAIMNYMMDGMLDYRIALRRAGDILYYGKSRMYDSNYGDNSVYKATRELLQLLGDPMVSIRLGNRPDLFFQDEDVHLYGSGADANLPTESDETVSCIGSFYNNGYAVGKPFRVRLIRTYKSISDTLYLDYDLICSYQNFRFDLPILGMPGEHSIEMFIECNNFADANLSDNVYRTKFYVYSQNLMPIEPLTNWNVSASKPIFRFVNPLDDTANDNALHDNAPQFEYFFKIYTISDGDTNLVVSSDSSQILKYETHIDWRPQAALSEGKEYYLSYSLLNLSTGVKGYEVVQPFYATKDISETDVSLFTTEHFNEMNCQNMSTSGNALSISNPKVDFYVLSVNGDPEGKFTSWGKIALGDDIYYDHQYLRGINVVILPKNTDNPKGRYMRYDTWESLEDAENFVRLLRDTVTEDDYVMISNCGQSYRAFVELSPKKGIAYIDSLVTLLEQFGATKAGGLGMNKSYAFVGYKGASPSEVFEMINDYDSSYVRGALKFFASRGKATSQMFGPAKQWKRLYLQGVADEGAHVAAKVTFSNAEGTSTLERDISDFGELDISDVSADLYPFANFEISLERDSHKAEGKVSRVSLRLVPAPELAIVRSATALDKSNLMRGDTLGSSTRIRNLSLRSSAENIKLKHAFSGANFPKAEVEQIIPFIDKDTAVDFASAFGTEHFSGEVIVSKSIELPIAELFNFNNVTQNHVTIFEDTAKPTAVVKFDGKNIANGDYISSSPEITVEIYDNSALPLTRNTDVLVRINGAMQTAANTRKYDLELFEHGSPLKAKLTILPDTLTETDNSVFVYFSDASSNKDTLRYLLKIVRSGKIVDNYVYPNPSSYSSNFKFSVQSPRNEGNAVISIYNFAGELLRELEQPVTVGENIIDWDNRDSYGNSLPTGLYLYMIRIKNSLYFDNAYGKFVIMR